MLMISRRKDVKVIMDNLKRINENYDQKGIAERQEQLVQQRMSAMLTTLYLARKELPYTKQRN